MVDVSNYELLGELEFILLRPDTFVGSIEPKMLNSYIFKDNGSKPVWRDITYSPALLKLFDEVLQNCYDHSKRPEGKHLNKVDIVINPMSGMISISDNGGIPVVNHPKHNMLVPCMIFGNLRSGSNYNDNDQREGGGRNGLGSKLTNIFSTYFKVETADGIN
jgi:DNA topoisomerase-2